MTAHFPILSEGMTHWDVRDIIVMPRFGWVFNTCQSPGWAPDPADRVDQFADRVCGPANENCIRMARTLKQMPEGSRWAFLGGWIGRPLPEWDDEQKAVHYDQTLIALGRYIEVFDEFDIIPDGFIHDLEGDAHEDTALVYELLYESGIFDIKRTRCAGWNAYDGIGVQRDQDGEVPKVRGVIDGRTATVDGYLHPEGAQWPAYDQQVDYIVKQADGAMNMGLDFVALAAGLTHGQDGKPTDTKYRNAYRRMARELAARLPVVVWLFPTAGQGQLNDPNTSQPTNVADSLAVVEAWRGVM